MRVREEAPQGPRAPGDVEIPSTGAGCSFRARLRGTNARARDCYSIRKGRPTGLHMLPIAREGSFLHKRHAAPPAFRSRLGAGTLANTESHGVARRYDWGQPGAGIVDDQHARCAVQNERERAGTKRLGKNVRLSMRADTKLRVVVLSSTNKYLGVYVVRPTESMNESPVYKPQLTETLLRGQRIHVSSIDVTKNGNNSRLKRRDKRRRQTSTLSSVSLSGPYSQIVHGIGTTAPTRKVPPADAAPHTHPFKPVPKSDIGRNSKITPFRDRTSLRSS